MNKLVRKVLIDKRKVARIVFFLFFDVIFICLSVYLSFFLRFEGQIPASYFPNIWGMLLLSLAILIPILYFSKLYYFTWIYVSTEELVALVKAVGLSFLILITAIFILRDHPVFVGFPRSTIFITYFLIFIFSGAVRFTKRIYLSTFGKTSGKERTLIIGAGDAGEQMLRSIASFRHSPFLPVGFIDDNLTKQGVLIHGVKVLGRVEDITKIIKEKNVEGLIVALPSAGSKIIREAVEMGRNSGLRKIKIIPPMTEVINGHIGISNLKEVGMEDLLGREPVDLDKGLIENSIKNKRVLITGAAGSIGSELCRQVIKFKPQELFILDQDETGIFNLEKELKSKFLEVKSFVADVRDSKRMEHIFNTCGHFDVVFHAAAYKHVPLMENNSEEAINNNVFGTEVLVKLSLMSMVEKFVFISTDKAVKPSSIMGATKRLGEMICQSKNQDSNGKTKFISVRFGNVLGSRGSVIPTFKEKIKKRETIEITHAEMKRYFMTTPEACLLVMQAGAMGNGGEVFVLDMGDPVKIIDLAKELIRLSGLEPDKDIPIVFTDPRPGEKFFEELLTAEEGTVATQNQKIFIAKLSKIDINKLNLNLEELKKAVKIGKVDEITKILKDAIPTFNE